MSGGPTPRRKQDSQGSAKTLIFMRHAQSPFGGADKQRKISTQGEQDAKNVAKRLRALGVYCCFFMVSPAKRTQMTCSIVQNDLNPSLVSGALTKEKLYEASMGDILDIVQNLSPEVQTVCIVGHNPGISKIVNFLFNGQGATHDDMELAVFPPASCAVLDWESKDGESLNWKDIQPSSMKLRHFLTP